MTTIRPTPPGVGSQSACPFVHAAAAEPQTPSTDRVDPGSTRDLAPCHAFLAKDDVPTPVPMVEPGAWKHAKHYDVVVAGAGMSGLHTAWRLRGLDGSTPPHGRVPEVAVFERTHHQGGRVRSFPVEGAQIPIDLGAMRFIPTQHKLVNGLVEHFHLPTRAFVVGGEQNLQYFRGVRLTHQQVAKDPSQLPYHLAALEQGKGVDRLLEMAINAVVPNFRAMSPEQFRDALRRVSFPVTDPSTGQTAPVPLSQLGLRNVLERALSPEAVALVTDAVGYHSVMENWDAATILEMLADDFQPGVTYRTPVDGMAALPRALARDLKRDGTPIEEEQALRRVEYDPEAKRFHLTFQSEKGEVTPVVADQLVLAMPKIPLQHVVSASPFLQGTPLALNLNQVTAIPMTRIFVTFDKAWWKEQGIQSGRSVTDTPLDQVYYYGREGDTRPYLEVYADGENSKYWEGLQNPGDPGVTTRLCASPQLADELKRELEAMHGRQIPAPNGFLYKRWADPFLGAAYHAWNPGSNPEQTSEAMIAPVDGVPLYVCGEAFSTAQGWIEGALQTSEQVLAKMGWAAAATADRDGPRTRG